MNRRGDRETISIATARRAAAVGHAPAYFHRKRFVVRVLSAAALVLALPLVLISIFLVRLTSRGNPIYRQTRMGRGGKPFTIYKIRTMRINAEKGTGPVWSAANDPRITPVGRLLRRTHLDELPQLWNVVRGDMCLFGPRPERPEIVERLVAEIPDYMQRTEVLPGVTGLAQIMLPADEDVDGVRRKLAVDLEYIRLAGPLLDLRILVCTTMQTLGIGREASLWLCRIASNVPSIKSHTTAAPKRRAA